MLRFQQVWEGEKEIWWVLLCTVGSLWYKNSHGERSPEWATQVLEKSRMDINTKRTAPLLRVRSVWCVLYLYVCTWRHAAHIHIYVHIRIYIYGCWYSESIPLGLCSSSPPGTAELKAVAVTSRNKCALAEAMPFLPAYVWDQRLGGDPVSSSPLQVVEQTWLLPAFHPVVIRDKSAEKQQPVLADNYIQLLKQLKP